jgi:U4/U6.U5 tri-snRNP-associated protein 1
VRNRRELNASLKGTTLGDADEDTDDALKWIKKAKKREKELAKKREEEMDIMDKAVQDEYSESELLYFYVVLESLLIELFVYRGSRRPQG